MALEPDKCSWFEFKTIIEDDLNFKTPFSLYYLLPHALTYEEGLKKLVNDDTVMEMSKIGLEFRVVDCYVINATDDDNLLMETFKICNETVNEVFTDVQRKKMTARRKMTSTGAADLVHQKRDQSGPVDNIKVVNHHECQPNPC
jgi:hypothetical protein